MSKAKIKYDLILTKLKKTNLSHQKKLKNLYNAPILGSSNTEANKEIEKQQHRFFNICVNIVEQILKYLTYPIVMI
jgi:hypothetical protein